MAESAPLETGFPTKSRNVGSNPTLSAIMKIKEIRETWIHTHFLTDGERLSVYETKRIKREMEDFLRKLGIVFGIHFRHFPSEKGIRIVLECRPFPEVLEKIKKKLSQLLEPIPSSQYETKVKVRDECKER